MNKILRLSIANIKKHKKQTALLMMLIFFCMAIMSSAVAGSMDMTSLFRRVADKYAVHKNSIMIKEDYFSDRVMEILQEDEKVTDTDHFTMLFSTATKYLDSEGEEQALYMSFVTSDMEKRIECSPIDTSLTDEEIASIEHPIYMPYAGRESLASNLHEGDCFDVIIGTKKFSFIVAGFYNSIFMPETNMGFQMIVSDSDLASLMTVIGKYEMVLFDCDDPYDGAEVSESLRNTLEEETGKDVGAGIQDIGIYKYLEQKSTIISGTVVAIMLFMAAVILVASVIMIRFRIAGDIQDQMQSIGVLEALGYTSKEIALSYTAEYLITAAAGVITGTGAGFALLPLLHKTAETLSGYHGSMLIVPLPIFVTGLLLLVLVGLTAHIRALAVRKYPPVQAFRKGIAVHHFGRNYFPLKDTKKSVHLRMAMKGFFGSMKQNISLTICIAVSAMAAVSGLMLSYMFGTDMKVAERMTGTELPDLTVTIMRSADIDSLLEDIAAMPEVERAEPGSFSLELSLWQTIYAFDHQYAMIAVAYQDFNWCENIKPSVGRLPEHDNEVAVTRLFASWNGLSVGDDITFECNSVKKNYIITGIVPSISNNGANVYLTEQALKRINPAYRPSAIEVYLKDGTDTDEFQTVLTQTYGRSVSDTRRSDSTGDTMEQRLSQEADRLIAEYLANHGADHIEYSIQIGDSIISGTSDSFAIRNVQNLGKIMRTQIGGYFRTISITSWALMGISAVVSGIIIIALMEQAVRRQRKELGIMLGLGYTSKELMLQLALRSMPAVIAAVILGTFGALAVFYWAIDMILGAPPVNVPLIAAAVVVMMLFCFGCAYMGASRIKKISVTEIMAE